ncbi:hypothetical protein D3C72_1918870 [compost metagenome]
MTSTSVFFGDSPRRPIEADPAAKLPVYCSSKLLPALADRLRSTSVRVERPVCRICSRVTICTGLGPAVSLRLMFEPVTSTVPRVVLSLPVSAVSAAPALPATRASATALESRVVRYMEATTPNGGGAVSTARG